MVNEAQVVQQAPPQEKVPSFTEWLAGPEALALSAGLLQASGPSRTPVSFGQALGAGIQNMLQVGHQYGNQNLDKEKFAYQKESDNKRLGFDEKRLALDEKRYSTSEKEQQLKIQELEDRIRRRKEMAQAFVGNLQGDPQTQAIPTPEGRMPMPPAMVYPEVPSAQSSMTPSPAQITPEQEPTQPSVHGSFKDLDPMKKAAVIALIEEDKFKEAYELSQGRDEVSKDNIGIEKDLRSEYRASAKDFTVIRDSFGRILESAQQPSGAGDLALIFNYMKMLDPNSVVRESEFSNAETSVAVLSENKVPNYFLQWREKILKGGRLAPEQRQDFVNRAERLYGSQKESQLQSRNEYERIAKSYGVDPKRVLPDVFLDEEKTQQKSNKIREESYREENPTKAEALKWWLKQNKNKLKDAQGNTFDQFWKSYSGKHLGASNGKR